ncbi:unnamed protein product [Adineta steineri]|uniref:Uncharacterized protein n=1 Tax=Adineta steineri TaxID=433720 RepID=A0A815M421_9BILA|nr:unnamed protein product [Adineta steineri]CAF1418267.1 unnamed protein product [Adineta steineri]CAF1418820.1 unnamed protein product [Adineta steineri]
MASNNIRRSNSSYSASDISASTAGITVNPRYACEWDDTCQRQHEFDDCPYRPDELGGKLGIYYSPNASYKQYVRDEINNRLLQFNPTGCTMVHLLIYKIENDKPWLLFVSKSVREKRQHNREEVNRQLLLTFPSTNPRKKYEDQKEVAGRALETVTNENKIVLDLPSDLKRFLFVNANSIYPLCLTNEQADLLTKNFSPNEEVASLHWFRLSTVLHQLPAWKNYLFKQSTETELAQVQEAKHRGIRLCEGSEECTLRSLTAICLMCIRNYVGFKDFLNYDL